MRELRPSQCVKALELDRGKAETRIQNLWLLANGILIDTAQIFTSTSVGQDLLESAMRGWRC